MMRVKFSDKCFQNYSVEISTTTNISKEFGPSARSKKMLYNIWMAGKCNQVTLIKDKTRSGSPACNQIYILVVEKKALYVECT